MIFLPANPCTCITAVLTHIQVLIFPRNPKDPFCFKKMNFNSYIPPSDDDTYDQEVFQHFLQRNQVTSVSNPEYEPVPSPRYSQLVPLQLSSTFGK